MRPSPEIELIPLTAYNDAGVPGSVRTVDAEVISRGMFFISRGRQTDMVCRRC
jgi:hypothetical protein